MNQLTKEEFQKILLTGETLDHWACDQAEDGSSESNAGVENLMYCNDNYYLVISNFDRKIAYGYGSKINLIEEDARSHIGRKIASHILSLLDREEF